MADYVVRLTGQDNLSSTVKQVKKELNDIGNVGNSAMEKIDKRFNRIINSSAPLKRQLKDLQQIMADMNMKGLSKTDEFTKIAVEAGKIKDAMDDAAQAVRNYSNDTMALQASIQMLQSVAAAGSVATGVMALFGTENKNVAQAIKRTQGALAVLNGLQSLANSLNKDSVLVLKLKQIQQAWNTKTTIANNVATQTNTGAVGRNTAATVASTLAQKAHNTTVAIGKALFGDFSGLILLGAAALTAYSVANGKSKSKQDELNDSVSKGSEIQQQYTSTLSSTYANLMSKYTQLREEYKRLSTEHQKTEWIANNKNELENLGLSVRNVTDADNAFINNTANVEEAFKRRAEAAARAAQLTALYQKKFELQQQQSDLQTTIRGNFSEVRRINKQRQTKGTYTWGEAQTLKENRKNEEELRKTNNSLMDINLQISESAKRFGELNGSISTVRSGGGGGRTTSTGGHTTTTTDNTPKYAKDSLSDLEHRLSEMQQKLKDGLIPTDKIEETKIDIENLKKEILKKKILLGIEIDPAIKESEETKRRIKEEIEKYFASNQDIQLTPSISTFDKAVGNNPFDTNTLDGLENMISFNDTLIGSLETTRKKLLELKEALSNAGMEGTESFQNISNELDKVDGSIATVTQRNVELSEQAKQVNEEQKKREKQIETYNTIADAAQNAGAMIREMANVGDDKGMQAAAIIAEAIANVIAGYASASAQASELGPWGWAAFSLAGLAQVASVIAQIHSLSGYASGGIIGGGSNHGDSIYARVNAGEMILNPRQQSNLFKAINDGSFGFDNQTNEVPSIQFKIKGSDLYGSLKNYSKTAGVSGKITGIK